MTDATPFSSFFTETTFDSPTFDRYCNAVHATFQTRERFATLLREQAADDPLRLGIGLLILGHYSEAIEALDRAPDSKEKHYYAADAARNLRRFDDALERLGQAVKAGWDAFDADMRAAEIDVQAGNVDAADKLLNKHEQAGQDRADWYHVRALVAETRGEREEALTAYDRALTLDPEHVPALFRAARLHDLLGNDAHALMLYNRLAHEPRAHVNALINAAVVFEDTGRYDEAANCLRRVLKAYPNHARARLFLKDVESCRDMIIVERGEDQVDARSRLLDTPLSEFELSVRARNCLKKMNIRTIGELIQLSEQELLAYKNFGETSLNEIRALLDKKGLRLGQRLEDIDLGALALGAEGALTRATAAAPAPAAAERPAAPPVPRGQEAVLNKPVSDLELSVRARRCLQRLNVQTLADLVQLSESELLATRNFGETSLNEVKARLADHGLQLAPKKA